MLNLKEYSQMSTAAVRSPVDLNLSNLTHDEILWKKILGYDLSVVTKTFAERNSQFAGSATEIEVECKRFMYLACIAPNLDLAPTKPIDEYWHQFVLFTEEYEYFCAEFNGYFVHHNPLAGPDHASIFERTQQMVVKLFGDFKNRSMWFLQMPATSCKCTNTRRLTATT